MYVLRWWTCMLFCQVSVCLVDDSKFGERNKYTCHCDGGECDSTNGFCSSGKCQRGWSGNNCQKENVALDKPTWQSSSYSRQGYPSYYLSNKAVDGNTVHTKSTDNCTHTDVGKTYAEWGVDLQQSYPVQEIKIYVRDHPHYTCLEGFKLYVSESNTTRTECQHHEEVHPEFTVRCNNTGQFVTITNANNEYSKAGTFVNLCEVEVYVCAVGTYGPNCSSLCYCEDTNARCDVTNGCQGGCISGYRGRYCNKTCSSKRYGKECSNLCSDRKCLNKGSSCNNINGSCDDTGCLPGWKGLDCTEKCNEGTPSWNYDEPIYYGKYGAECKKGCYFRNCLNSASTCNHVTGEYIGGCKDGYEDIDCTKNCSIGTYGKKCEGLCSNRRCMNNASSCNNINGSCDDKRCLPGWEGVDCTKACSNGAYGLECRNECSKRHCLDTESVCDNIKGTCINGCSAGYDGEDCTKECMKGFYGAGCKEICSSRHCLQASSSCDHVTGRCDEELCLDGWKEKDCTQKIEASLSLTYGLGGAMALLVVEIFCVILFVLQRRWRKSKHESNTNEHIYSSSTRQGGDVSTYGRLQHSRHRDIDTCYNTTSFENQETDHVYQELTDGFSTPVTTDYYNTQIDKVQEPENDRQRNDEEPESDYYNTVTLPQSKANEKKKEY